jgi:hypothetical protein
VSDRVLMVFCLRIRGGDRGDVDAVNVVTTGGCGGGFGGGGGGRVSPSACIVMVVV